MTSPSSAAQTEERAERAAAVPRERRVVQPVRWPWFRGTAGHASTENTTRPEPVWALARPRRMKQSARSVLWWSLACYALATLALDLVMDRWCPAPFEKVYRTKWDELCQIKEQNPDRPLLVMLGSSRTDGGFQAGRLDGMPDAEGRPLLPYNFGVPAAGPIHEYLYLRQMLAQGIRPRLLLVEFLPPLFNDAHSRLISEENWTFSAWVSGTQMIRMAPYMVRPARKGREWMLARLGPWYAHRGPINGWIQDQLDPPEKPVTIPWYHDRWGTRYPEDLTPAEHFSRSMVARDYVATLGRFRLGREPAQAMRDLLECCRQERIPVALVLTPESTVFHSWYSPTCRTMIRGLLEELRAAYGVPVIDATHWLKDTDFVDGHHLEDSGATRFTGRLRDEVRRMLQ